MLFGEFDKLKIEANKASLTETTAQRPLQKRGKNAVSSNICLIQKQQQRSTRKLIFPMLFRGEKDT